MRRNQLARRYDARNYSRAPRKGSLQHLRTGAAIGLGKTSIYEAIKEGKLKSVRICGRRLILKTDLEAFLASCRKA